MKSKLFTLLILLAAILLFGGLSYGDFTITQITTNSYEDSLPQIKDNYLVWQGYVDGDWEIFLYNITTGTTTQITENNYNDMSPQTDGNWVVWQGYNRTGGEIFLYHIGDPTPITSDGNAITNDTNIDCSPQIANGRMVWTLHQVTESVEPGEIILYEIGISVPTTLSALVDLDGTLDDSFPRINDTEVIWVQADENGTTTLFIYDLTKKNAEPEPAPEGYVWSDSPQSDGSLSVFARYDGHDREIFIHNGNLRSYEQITNNDIEDSYPRISGNHIAWMGGKGKMREIFLAELPSLLLVSITPDTIVVEEQEKIKVIVTNEEGKEVPGATVTLSGCGVDEIEVTDKNGKVKFKNVNPSEAGTIRVTVSKDGYFDYIGSITVNEAK